MENDPDEISKESLNDTNSKAETSYLNKSEVNKIRLQDAIDEINDGIHYKHDLIEY